MKKRLAALFLAAVSVVATPVKADVYNLKVVTDANPDYHDLPSLIHSTTSNWTSDKDKMWALFYWNHIARRQTNPMILHGKAETDPIRQFNDYGYAMCSTISGIQMAIWEAMGYKAKYYDISLHTVAEVFYDTGWHHYDNSLSVHYTLCDGKTVAGIEDIGKTLACEASGGKEEPGHIAIYHALNGTGPDGFLEGADTIRDLRHLGRDTFAPNVLKYRYYFNDAERGHRYILNLRDNEVYRRSYSRLDKADGAKNFVSDVAYFTPNGTTKDGKPVDPESKNPRYQIRGNGERTLIPTLNETGLFGNTVVAHSGIKALQKSLQPAAAGKPAEVVFKVEGANVITSLKISGELLKASNGDTAAIAVSTDNGHNWTEVYTADAEGNNKLDLKLIEQVSGAYEVLVKVAMTAKANPAGVQLKAIRFDTITQINSKTQPQLKLGRNTIYVGAGPQTGSIVVWPELVGDAYKKTVFEEHNMRSRPRTKTDKDDAWGGWNAVVLPAGKGEGHLIYKIDAPHDITQITQTGRMYVRTQGAEVRFEHSFDGGKTWIQSFKFTDTEQPWDDIHDQVIKDIPKGTKSVLVKYAMTSAGLYSLRIEANHKIAETPRKPVDVTFTWSERQADYSLVQRSHTQRVDKLPATYTINVGGADHPVVESLTISEQGVRLDVKLGYSDGKDVGGEKFVGKWVTWGKVLSTGKQYTVSVPPSDNTWDAGDPDGKRLTDGVVGSSYSGGISYRSGALWAKGKNTEITVDMGEAVEASVFRIHIHGYPAQDAIRGEVKDEVDVLVSEDGQTFKPAGKFNFNLLWKDVPVNYMWSDEERFVAHNHALVLDKPVKAKFVKFAVKPSRFTVISEVQVLDGVKYEPFDLKLALPKDVSSATAMK